MVQYTRPKNQSSIDSMANKPQKNTEAVIDIAQYREPEEVDSTSDAFNKVMSQMNIDNRRAFDEMYKKRWIEASNDNLLLSILLCDIDYFKEYKDNCGEQSTSFMLIMVALELKKICDKYGCFLAYYQNEGFAILHTGGDEKQSLELAEELRKSVEVSKSEHKFSAISDVVTLSIGISSIYPTSMKQLMQQADQSLRDVKKTALNKVGEQSLPKHKARSSVKPLTEQNKTDKVLTQKEDIKKETVAKTDIENKPVLTNPIEVSPKTETVSKESELKIKPQPISKPIIATKLENKVESKLESKLAPINTPIVDKKTENKIAEKNTTKESKVENNLKSKLEFISTPIVDKKTEDKITEENTEIESKIESKREFNLDSASPLILDIKTEDEITEIETFKVDSKPNLKLETALTLSNENNIQESINDSSEPTVEKKTIKRHINALKSLVTKTSKNPSATPATEQAEKNSILSSNPNEAAAQTIDKSKLDPILSTPKETSPLKAIEIDNAATSINKVKQAPSDSKIKEQDLLKSATQQNNKVDTTEDKVESKKSAPKSAIELHIEALKAAKSKKIHRNQPLDNTASVKTVKNELTLTENEPVETKQEAPKQKETLELSLTENTSDKTKQEAPKEKVTTGLSLTENAPEKTKEVAKEKVTTGLSLTENASDKTKQEAPKEKVTNGLSLTENAPEKTKQEAPKEKVTTGLSLTENASDKTKQEAPKEKVTTGLSLTENAPEKTKQEAPKEKVTTELSLTENAPEKTKQETPKEKVTAGLSLTENTSDKTKQEAPKEKVTTGLSLTENASEQTKQEAPKEKVTTGLSLTENASEQTKQEATKVESNTAKEATQVVDKDKAEKVKPKSAIELHIEALNAAKSTKKIKPTEKIKPADIKIEEEKKTTSKPKSAIELHIEEKKKPASKPKSAIELHIEAQKKKLDGQIASTDVNDNVENSELQKRLLAENVGNKLAFKKKTDALWQECCDEDEFLSMIITGVDFFKSYKENYGQETSDNTVVSVASSLIKTCEKLGAFIYYIDDRDFIILLKGGNATKALRMAEQMRKLVEGTSIPHQHSKVSKVVTMTVGLASIFPSNSNSIAMLREESEDAYDMAIRLGRNQTYLG